jgi:uncharacterized membrane protein YdbT with pleckstrin-like domain
MSLKQPLPNETILYEGAYHWIKYFSIRSLKSLGIIPLLESFTDEFIITNKRVISRVGIIQKKERTFHICKVEGVQVKQSILGRILGYGDVTISGTGSMNIIIPQLKRPDLFKLEILKIQCP